MTYDAYSFTGFGAGSGCGALSSGVHELVGRCVETGEHQGR